MTITVTLREIAHSRSGEKGNNSMISVIAYDMADYELLCQQVTVEAVRALFGPITKGDIERYEAPRIGALNFVLNEVLEGGRSRTLAFEESGKALSSLMLTLPIVLPKEHLPRKRIGPMDDAPSTDQKTRSSSKRTIRLGSATAWSRDRFGPAEAMAKRGDLDYLCFESMSEITMSAAQAARQDGHGSLPYDPYLIDRLGPILKTCKDKGIKIISNQGWLDPDAAALQLQSFARQHGIEGLKIAAVRGGILTEEITGLGLEFLETGLPVADSHDDIVSAEAYLGCEGIVRALSEGADVVLT
ncbi:MAG: acyclic terpene utilization AtuA family protein, partial [Burkholderiaceae bacterium]